jgi:hypothetical protein
MVDNRTTEHPYCEGHHKLLSIKCRRCPIWRDCWCVTAFNDYMKERERKCKR